MGNSQSQYDINTGLKEFIGEQFTRLLKDQGRNHLKVTQLLLAMHPEDFPIEFRHLAVLYICDQDRDGVFTIRDLQCFALWVQINLPGIQMYEFQAQLQARTTATLIQDIQHKSGEETLNMWFMRVLLRGHRNQEIQGQAFISIDAIKTIFEVFSVQLMTGMDIQSFFHLVKKSSEELGFQIQEILQNDEEEEYISIVVCEEFVRHFIKGVLKTLREIGYNSEEL